MALAPLTRSLRSLNVMTITRPIVGRLYHDNVIDHYENPRNVGSLDKKDENVGTGEYSTDLHQNPAGPAISAH